jgi:hypothetical protein
VKKTHEPNAPWLTAADRAEWDLVWRQLIDLAFEHRERCFDCAVAAVDGDCCSIMRAAIESAVEWAEKRSDLSYAIAMRARQDVLDREVLDA